MPETSAPGPSHARPMRVFVRPGSQAERTHHAGVRAPRPEYEALAAGFKPTPAHDLKFRGGRTIEQLSFVNYYVGGSRSWHGHEVDAIDHALATAMADTRLNNVMRQYFGNRPIASTFLGSHFVGRTRPTTYTQASVRKSISSLFNSGRLRGFDLPSTVVNLLLPSGTILTDEGAPVRRPSDDAPPAAGAPGLDEVSSLEGLGGYHGSIDLSRTRVYYAVGVYSERLRDGRENGIAVFDEPWKNVVATFYHELNEARTDPDVDDAIRTGRVEGIIGWNSEEGEECGDYPVFEAGSLRDLKLVFQEVGVAGGFAPVQFQYSNAVHGPEGPIPSPHPASGTVETA
jgi:hypothetical protein